MSTVLSIDTTVEGGMDRPAYEPLESGKYDLEITNKLESKPSKSCKPGETNYGVIQVDYKENTTGKRVTDWISLHPKMAWKLNQFAVSAGVVEAGQALDIDLQDFDGRVVTAIVGQRTYQKDGETKIANEIKEYIYE